MRPIATVKYEHRLDSLMMRAPLESEEASHWAKYICVLASGYLEVGIRSAFQSYVDTKSSPVVAKYVSSKLKGFQNPKMGSILSLIGTFDTNWKEDAEKWAAGEIKDHVDSLVANRHHIAHGRDSTVTLSSVGDWYKSAKKLIAFIEQLCELSK